MWCPEGPRYWWRRRGDSCLWYTDGTTWVRSGVVPDWVYWSPLVRPSSHAYHFDLITGFVSDRESSRSEGSVLGRGVVGTGRRDPWMEEGWDGPESWFYITPSMLTRVNVNCSSLSVSPGSGALTVSLCPKLRSSDGGRSRWGSDWTETRVPSS